MLVPDTTNPPAISRRRGRWLFVALTLTAAILLAGSASPALAKQVGPFADNGAQETVISDMTTHPAAVHSGTKTWIAYQGTGYDPYICEYDSATGVWAGPFRIGINPLLLDGHGAPALWLAPDGNLHVYWGGHNTPMQHARTMRPGTIANWMTLPDVAPATTYPEAVTMSDGTMQLFYRDATNVGWVSKASTDGATFGPRQRVLARDFHTGWYADFHGGSQGKVLAAFVREDLDAFNGRSGGARKFFSRFDLYYVSRDASGTWYDAAGSALPTDQPPVVPQTVDGTPGNAIPTANRCLVFPSLGRLVNEVTVREDDSGAPCILALVQTGPTISEFTWKYFRREGGTWRSSDVCVADHFFDSATFEPGQDGQVDAWLVSGRATNPVAVDNDFTDRGGPIDHYVSSDHGATWSLAPSGTITPGESPGEAPIVYSDPVLVSGGAPGQRVVFADWTQDITDFYRRLFLWGDGGIVGRDTEGTAERLAGSDRVETAVQVSQKAFPEGALAVVLATDRTYPDALAGAPLAARLGGPLLLNGARVLSADVAAEILRLHPSQVIALGTADVISDKVLAQVKALGVVDVTRIGGATRFDTMLGVARMMKAKSPRTSRVVVVSGRNWADAAAVAPIAAANGWPIVLTEPNSICWQTLSALSVLEATSTVVVGGTGAVSDSVAAAIPHPERIWGADRYETASALATWSLDHGMLPDRVMVASGENFPDALAGASLGQHLRSPLLLTRRLDLPQSASDYFWAHRAEITRAFAVGGSDVVSEQAWSLVKSRADVGISTR